MFSSYAPLKRIRSRNVMSTQVDAASQEDNTQKVKMLNIFNILSVYRLCDCSNWFLFPIEDYRFCLYYIEG